MSGDLQDFKVLISRPEQFADELVAKIHSYRGDSVCVPLFSIENILNSALIKKIIDSLQNCQLAIFVSRNAAEFVLPHVDKTAATHWAAIGPSTAKYLEQNGLTKISAPNSAPFDSAALMKHLRQQVLNLQQAKVTIFNGEDGLSWLAEELMLEGAVVETVSVYKRVMPDINAAYLAHFATAIAKTNIILITCVTSLITLHKLAIELGLAISKQPLLVVGDRIYRNAIEMGFLNVYTAKSMSDADILSALLICAKIYR